MVQCAGQCGAGMALNEVSHPSKNARGPHVHVQTKPGKGGYRGDLPSKKKTRVSNHDQDFYHGNH